MSNLDESFEKAKEEEKEKLEEKSKPIVKEVDGRLVFEGIKGRKDSCI